MYERTIIVSASYQHNRQITGESFEIIEGIGTTQVAAEGSQRTASEEEESIVHIVVVVELAEADHKAHVGEERWAGMVGVGVAGADRVKVGGELGAGDTPSTVVGVEVFDIAVATAAEVQRADANMG